MIKLILISLALYVTVVSSSVIHIYNPLVNVYRYWNGKDHFYTRNSAEIGTTTVGKVGKYNYKCEGVGFRAFALPSYGTVPFHRYYNGVEHFYTTNAAEIGTTVVGQVGKYKYKYEGVAAYVYPSYKNGLKPLYRYWNGVEHFYTKNANEIGTTTPGQVGNYGYKSEGVACWVY